MLLSELGAAKLGQHKTLVALGHPLDGPLGGKQNQLVALVATTTLKSQDEKYTIGIQELAQEMFRQEAETLMLFEEDDQYMINNVKAITNEAIPLSEQLPSELSPAQRAEILREYYKAKTAALKNFRVLAYTDEIID